MSEERKLKDLENLPEPERDLAKENKNKFAGLNGSNLREPVPKYNKTPCEKVIKNKNNSWIILGRDRPSTPPSGYGGQGATQCGSIDLVVGRMSSVDGGPKSKTWVSPNFTSDAARIYISQRTDLDENFNLVAGNVGTSKGRSGIGIKADAVRVIAREGIKLVTGTDKKNSQDGKIKSTYGIDLIAGNDDSNQKITGTTKKKKFLQPIVKGDNLIEALDELSTQLGDLATRFHHFSSAQVEYNRAIQSHVHTIAPLPKPTEPSVDLVPNYLLTNIKQHINSSSTSWAQSVNLSNFKNNFLKPYADQWICSRHNRTT
jgi:hypothetical protein